MTIGEFSSRCGLSVKVLRSYAEAGLLLPAAVDPASGYRYYHPAQLDDAELVVLLRRAGVAVADIGPFLAEPAAESLDGWERSLVAEVHARREALSSVRCRLNLGSARTRGATMIEIRPVRDIVELEEVLGLLQSEPCEPVDANDRHHLVDLDERFADDRTMMILAVAEERAVGAAFAFRSSDLSATLRTAAVVATYRHRGIGRRLVERVESEAFLLGVQSMWLGTEESVGFWYHLGYTPNLLLQWVYDTDRYEAESEAVLAGPLAGLAHWRSSFNDVPQLFVELDEPRLDLRHDLGEMLRGCHVGFAMSKSLASPPESER